MSKGHQEINGVKYYGCATKAEAAAIAGISSSSKELITINEVLNDQYLDIVEDPIVDYVDKQACAYDDIKKKDDPQIDQEKPAEINNIRVGVVQIENETTISYSDRVHRESKQQKWGPSTEESVWNIGTQLSVIVSFTVTNQNTVPITVKINNFEGSISGQYPSSNISKNLSYRYKIGSNWTEYKKTPPELSIPLNANNTLYFDFMVSYRYSGPNQFKGLECTISGSCTVTEHNNKINTSTSKIGIPLKKLTDTQLIDPSVNTYPLQSTISVSANLPQIDQASSKCKNGIMDIYLTGGQNKYAYTTCSKSSNTFFGFLVPIYLTDFNYTFTTNPIAVSLYNHLESIMQVSNDKFNNAGSYSPIMNSAGPSDYIKNTSGHISTEIYYGQTNFSKFETYYNSSNTPHMIIGMSFTNDIFPQSPQIDTKILSLVCEFQTYDSSQGSGTNNIITFNFWVKALNAVPVPEDPPSEDNAIYYYLPFQATQIVQLDDISNSNTKKLKSTFGTTNIAVSFVSKGSDGGGLYKVTKKDNSPFTFIGQTPNWPVADNFDMYDNPPTMNNLQYGADIDGNDNGYITVFYNSDITYIKLPNTVQTIGAGCFSHCSKLKQIDIPTSLSTLEYGAFYKCINLQTIDFSKSELNKISYWCFAEDYNLTEIYIPDKSLSIYSKAFQNCSKLDKVNIDFSQSDNSEQLGTGLDHISDLAFDGCTSLSSISIGKTNYIGKHAFRNCYSLENIYINNTKTKVGKIKSFAFIGCTNVKRITCRGFNPIMGMGNIWYAKSINPKTCKLYIEDNYKSYYQNAPQWGDFFTHDNVNFI